MKSILQSKTFWLAAVQGLIGVWAVVETAYPTLGWVAIVKTIIDIILRVISTQTVTVAGMHKQ